VRWIEAKVIFDSDNQQLAKELISDAFYTLGLTGVVVEEPVLEKAEDWAEEARRVPDYYAVSGYFPKNNRLGKRCRALEDTLSRLEQEKGIVSKVVYSEIDEEDWAESWKAYFWPEKISKRIVVKPTWREYEPDPGEIVIELDPGMAFGTGTHPTTKMCIHLIEKFLKEGDFVLDVGTGSGILMIAAAKLGAGKIIGVDIDEGAVEIARNNLLRNRIEKRRFEVTASNLVDGVEGRFDMVVCNVTSETIAVLLKRVHKVLSKEGIFIGSGIAEANKESVVEKMEAQGFEIIDMYAEKEWVSLAGKLMP